MSVNAQDDELFESARTAPNGDLRAFEELVERHQRRIVADCRHITKDESVAEDLAQEVFLKAFFGMKNFERPSSFRHAERAQRKGGGSMNEDEDVPISALARLESPVSASFLPNFRRKVYRRGGSGATYAFFAKVAGDDFRRVRQHHRSSI